MIPDNETIEIDFGGPASYRIIIKGSLDQDWSDRLAGMTITVSDQEGESSRTALAGRIRDQAELNGVLETLYSLHLPILRVEQVEDDS